jgi:hypothetical protein
MEKARGLEDNIFSVEPKNVGLSNTEMGQLVADSREAIDEGFVFTSYTETLSTLGPLEIFHIDSNHQYSLLTRCLPYNRADVTAVIDRDGDGSYLKQGRIKLFNSELQRHIHSEIIINASDEDVDDDDDFIDYDNPNFYINTPITAYVSERERIPLSNKQCRELLNYLVQQINPIASVTMQERTLFETIEAILAASEHSELTRSTKYQFETSDKERTIVSVHDRALIQPHMEPVHTYHEATVKKIRSFGKAGTLATSLFLKASEDETSATISKEFIHKDDCAEEIEKKQKAITKEHNSVWIDSPKKFGKQIISGIQLLATRHIGEKADQLEY